MDAYIYVCVCVSLHTYIVPIESVSLKDPDGYPHPPPLTSQLYISQLKGTVLAI